MQEERVKPHRRVAIVGSRDYPNMRAVDELLASLRKDLGITVVSGGARGVDTVVEVYAKIKRLPFSIFRPVQIDGGCWGIQHETPEGKKLLPPDGGWFFTRFVDCAQRRNKMIVDDADWVYAFWANGSRGTAHTITYATEKGKLWGVR